MNAESRLEQLTLDTRVDGLRPFHRALFEFVHDQVPGIIRDVDSVFTSWWPDKIVGPLATEIMYIKKYAIWECWPDEPFRTANLWHVIGYERACCVWVYRDGGFVSWRSIGQLQWINHGGVLMLIAIGDQSERLLGEIKLALSHYDRNHLDVDGFAL